MLRSIQIATRKRHFSTSKPIFSAYVSVQRKTVADIATLYKQKEPIAVITAWDRITANIAQNCDIDITLVGDSLAMVALGYDDTNEIELDEMLYHAKAVLRCNKTSLLVADIPFGTFEQSPAQALETAIKFIKKAGIQAVKVEGGESMAPTIRKLVSAGIPVMGHVGLTPQSHNAFGGYKLQGNSTGSAQQLLRDCRAIEEAGVFSMVLECIPSKLAELATQSVKVPTIGIGAGPSVSGQVLVMADLLGMNDTVPAKFVKKYMDFYGDATKAVAKYREEVKSGDFPLAAEHGYKMKSEVLRSAREYADKIKGEKH